ncbi:MAG: hypothetical protein WED82_06485 [Balneolales bacterium]
MKPPSSIATDLDTEKTRKTIHNWLKEGLIDGTQHDVILRILAAPPKTIQTKAETKPRLDPIISIAINYERERELIFKELIKSRQKLEWNRAILAETRQLLQMAINLLKRSTAISSGILRKIQ